jgi:pyruvate, water dikinase
MAMDFQPGTGLPGLDRLLRGLIPGDNLVWQFESIEDLAPFVPPYCQRGLDQGREVIYFRFADHDPLVPPSLPVRVCTLQPELGFEQFIMAVHQVLHESGRCAYFVFDSLTKLAETWHSDRMLGNFFRLTCPYVYDIESLAYFPIQRGRHSFHAITPITETAQVVLDVYRHRDQIFLYPEKVEHRYSPTMFMLHVWEADAFTPVMESSTTAEILTSMPWSGSGFERLREGIWNRNLLHAAETWAGLQRGRRTAEDAHAALQTVLRMMVSHDPRVLQLAEKYLTLEDVLSIGKRVVGTGLIGGKAVGMLLARAMLKKADPRWQDLLEPHDSFHIGSDVFYSFLVENGCWWMRQKQRDPATFLDGLQEVRRRIIMGPFPKFIEDEFSEMLAYFGQSPIIVRSSSLLEDNYGNAFSGKYESVFCANQGSHQKRLADFLAAVRTIYASTMSEKALRYRAQRGLLEQDEQMSLLVQRVSGSRYGHLFFPHAAGVAYSRNPYVWSEYIDPEAGMVRLVFGLGTRAVDRADDDYTRIVALNAPDRRPETGFDEVRQYSQRKVDVIDLEANQLVASQFVDLVSECRDLPISLFASPDEALARRPEARGLAPGATSILTFEQLLADTPFVADMRQLLSILQESYGCPVDVEFTANFFPKAGYRLNLVQCRPLPITAEGSLLELQSHVPEQDRVVESHSAIIGRSRSVTVDRVVYITPSLYGQLPIGDRYALARLVGRVLHVKEKNPPASVMLIGPGRWGTQSPSLGIPVTFHEIDRASVLCEVVAMREDLVPDVSLGTHFFNDLVEMDILYLAVFPGRPRDYCNFEFFESCPNRLAELVPQAESWAPVLRVIDIPFDAAGPQRLQLHADTLHQTLLCYLET